MPKLELIEDEISRKLAEAERTGELRSAPSFGKPHRRPTPAWNMTPTSSMPYQDLEERRNRPAGGVSCSHERARLREALRSAPDEGQRRVLRRLV
jgi:hypothetical protein